MRRLVLAANQSLTSPIVAVAGSAENLAWMTSATVRPAASSIWVLAMGEPYAYLASARRSTVRLTSRETTIAM